MDFGNPDDRDNGPSERTIGVAVCTPYLRRMVQEVALEAARLDAYDCAQDLLTQILKNPPHLVVVETESPAFDALETVLAMSRHSECTDTKILLMTPLRVQYQQSLREYIEKFKIREGYGAYLMIPLTRAELASFIHRLLISEPPATE